MGSRYLDGPAPRPHRPHPDLVDGLTEAAAAELEEISAAMDECADLYFRDESAWLWERATERLAEVLGRPLDSDDISEIRGRALARMEGRRR